MKLEPEEHQKAAADLRELADLSTKPIEKRGLLSLAAGFESVAKLGENEALLLDVRAELGEVRNEVGLGYRQKCLFLKSAMEITHLETKSHDGTRR
jgi:hypothetical protein